MGDLSLLRRQLRRRRQAIQGEERRQKSLAATQHAWRYIKALPAVKHVAVFLSLAEEIDTHDLIMRLWQNDYRLYLPVVLARNQALVWRHYHQHTVLQQDALGLWVPEAVQMQAVQLDVVVMPLVGFDAQGRRLGMGGGFYDRSFADKIAHQPPYLLGLAYQCQALANIACQPWDIPMDALATEAQLLHFN